MKKILASLSIAASLLVFPLLSFAQSTGKVNSIMPSANSAIGDGMKVSMKGGSIIETVSLVANYVVGALLLLAVFYVLLAAYNYMTSGGEAEKIKKGRDYIMYAGIGVVVALLAKGIVSLVLSAVNGK